MINVEKLYNVLIDNDVDFFTGVPDSLLQDVCAFITDNTPKERNVITANEGSAVGLASGYYMSTRKIPLVYMQNSGLGNAVNPLLSLADEKVYSLPILLMIGWRGEPGTKDEPQHKKQGEVTLDLLDAMQIPYVILDSEEVVAVAQINNIVQSIKKIGIPHAIVIRKGIFNKYTLKNKQENDYMVSREAAMNLVVDCLHDSDIVVSTTGKLSRELFEYRDSKGHGHERDFLTVGSMGHSSSIALGIAISNKNRTVFCFDGDGAFIMHMGAITNIGNLAPKNYRHIIFNNGSHESVGGQPTLGFDLDIPAIAKACGYSHAIVAETKDEIVNAMEAMAHIDGPSILEIKVRIDSRDNLGRPTTTPIENKLSFMNYIK